MSAFAKASAVAKPMADKPADTLLSDSERKVAEREGLTRYARGCAPNRFVDTAPVGRKLACQP